MILEWAAYKVNGEAVKLHVTGTVKAGVIAAVFKIPIDTTFEVNFI